MRVVHRFIALALLAFCLGASPALAKSYKIATVSPDGLGWMKQFRTATKQIDTLTEGRVKFKIYPGGVQGDDATVLRKMRIGQLHGGMVAAGSLTRFYPDLQIYNLPLQFRDYDEVDYIRGRMDSMISGGLEDAGIVTFAFVETGFAYLMTQQPITSVEELKELKAWIPEGDPIAAELIKSFDVSPIPLNITDVLAGLQTGLIDAVVVPPVVALALQWHNHVSHVMDLPLLYIYSTMAMDKKSWNRMSADDQALVSTVLDKTFTQVGEEARVDNKKAFDALLSIGIEATSPANLGEWQSVADKSVNSLLESGEITPDAVQLYLDNLDAYRTGVTAGGGR